MTLINGEMPSEATGQTLGDGGDGAARPGPDVDGGRRREADESKGRRRKGQAQDDTKVSTW